MNRRGSHAIVLGASLAGLVHAAALAGRFDRVTLVDRDALPDGSDQRRGVPQGPHVHLLIPGGMRGLEQLLPGVIDDLVARGAHHIPSPQWRFQMAGDRLALTDPDLTITGATRPLIEATVRERVLALPGVEMHDGATARGLLATEDGERIVGVALRRDDDPAHEPRLAADLVVDATGRGSSSPRWLAELGYAPPEEQRLKVDVHYTSRRFTRTETDLGGARNALVDVPPGGRRGGVSLAIEDGQWLVTLIGMLGERPPTDLAGFSEYAASLWSDDLHEIVAGADPVGEASEHAFPAFSWHRYDRLRRLPERYVVCGDAVCSLDPRFGQGMTVAILEALALGDVLDRHGLERVGRRTLAAARPTVQDAWDLATGTALAHPEVEGPRPLAWRINTAYMQRLLPTTHRDPEAAAAFLRVIAMLERPSSLMRPGMLARVRRAQRRTPEAPVADRVPSDA